MEVNLAHRNPMNMAFRLGNFLVNGQDIQLDHGGNGQPLHNRPDVAHRSMGVRVRFPFLPPMDFHRHMGAGNSAFFAFLSGKFHARNAQAVQLRQESLPLRQQLQ